MILLSGTEVRTVNLIIDREFFGVPPELIANRRSGIIGTVVRENPGVGYVVIHDSIAIYKRDELKAAFH